MLINQQVLDDIRQTIGSLAPETGGMLGGKGRHVTHFYFDGTASRTRATYSPDVSRVNRILSEQWNPAGIDLLGFVHSHPSGFQQPSGGDLRYVRTILDVNRDRKEVLLPIVQSKPETGSFFMQSFVARSEGARLVVEPQPYKIVEGPAEGPAQIGFRDLPMFARVRSAYDLDRLEASRVIAVGCGGAASFIEDLARAGVGEFVLIDPDVVSETNLATQQTYRSDVGRPKVDALADRLRNINPLVFVAACRMSLDELDDAEFCFLARTTFRDSRPGTVLLCGMTDDFYAQARVNRLALNFALPSLCAQVYEEGRGAEVTFTHPGVTRACHRCALRSRYRAYLENGFVNNVGSTGTPLYATARLNALKTFVAVALLHHNSSHRRWGGMVRRLGQRNLVQLRLDPDFSLPGLIQAFANADPDRLLCDEAVWLPQIPQGAAAGESPCPDCQGGAVEFVEGSLGQTALLST